MKTKNINLFGYAFGQFMLFQVDFLFSHYCLIRNSTFNFIYALTSFLENLGNVGKRKSGTNIKKNQGLCVIISLLPLPMNEWTFLCMLLQAIKK